jgi:ABC-2 type transport system permease protein
MHNILMVMRREYLDRVKRKSFWIGIFVGPLLIGGLIGISIFMVAVKTQEQRALAIVDNSGELAPAVVESLGKRKLNDGRPSFVVEIARSSGDEKEILKTYGDRIRDKELFGLIWIGKDPEVEGALKFYGRNTSEVMTNQAIENSLKDAMVSRRLLRSQLQLDRATLDKLTAGVDLETFEVTKEGGAQKKGFFEAYIGTFIFVIILFMSILLYGVAMLRGILEEKSNRIIEVLLGSLTPEQLMTGKILGIGLVGLTQMAIYVPTFGAIRLVMAAKAAGADLSGMQSMLSMSKLAYFIVFFLLGYFLYTALFAAVGAVCNTEQEAQNLQQPITMFLMLPYICTFFFVTHPDHPAAVILSFIPFFTPMIMFMRISVLTPPFWQIALSIVLMIATILLVFRATAKIFRIGILMYGKRPTVPEILRWARS